MDPNNFGPRKENCPLFQEHAINSINPINAIFVNEGMNEI